MNVDTSTLVQLILRHFLTTFGGWLVSHGYLQSSGLDGFVGAAMVIGGVLWSVWQKEGVAFLAAEKARLEKLVALYRPAAGTQGKP